MTAPVDISGYTKKLEAYPADLVTFFTENGLKLPGIESLRGQALALLAHPDNRGKRHVSRAEATEFFKKIGLETADSIQPFNKGFGLKECGVKGKTCLAFPFEKDTVNIEKRKGCAISGDRDEAIGIIKEYWKKNLLDQPNEKWQLGHLDPTVPDASEANLAWQPPIQGKFRDRFKWDKWFQKMWPTGAELCSKPDAYYTKDEQRAIVAAFTANLET
jgi:hypothetical protein